VFWLFCGIRVEQSLVFCVIIRRPLFILLPFFPLGLPDYPDHIFKLFLIAKTQSRLSFKTFTSCPLFFFTLCNNEDFILHNGKKISINKRVQVGQ
jgi:hypothetical protein